MIFLCIKQPQYNNPTNNFYKKNILTYMTSMDSRIRSAFVYITILTNMVQLHVPIL